MALLGLFVRCTYLRLRLKPRGIGDVSKFVEMDDLDVIGESSPSTSTTQTNGHSGITLVLPSLRALQAANAGKKSKPKQAIAELDQRPKIPRPVKLKPLKEVLKKLIMQIKKKDDYAFFIHPVDPAQVPGYGDVIKNPMDFGTMTVRVSKGKYRSLEDFTTDFRLVTTNAKIFNPPGSIYHTEADRLETWGLEHIARASAHVIEYETDWNIDVEQDEDGSTSQQPPNIEDEVSTPRDLDGSMAAGSRAPSMTPAPGQASTLGQGRRGPRGPYKKHAQTTLSEGLDADGRIPGVRDGVGAFPPGSDWAELMIALKIKGKRYKTKRERLRFEKEGPPYQADGSLDYAEMEDPFSILNVLVADPLARPQVAPLYPPPSTTTPTPITTTDGTQPQFQTPQTRIHAHMPITAPPGRPFPALATHSDTPTQVPVPLSTFTPSSHPAKKRRHWTIVRNVPTRSRAKDKDSDATADDTRTTPRDAGSADYGSFATFVGELAARTGTDGGLGVANYIYGSEQRLFATIRSTIEHRGVKRKREADETHTATNEKQGTETFWTDERAEEAWDYLRDVVYGGVDGYAYVRSLAEFVAPSFYLGNVRELEGEDDVDRKPAITPRDLAPPLGVPLPRYVEDNLVDMVTRGRHGWLRDVFLPAAAIAADPACTVPCGDGPTTPFHVRLAALPGTVRAVASPQEWHKEPLDMAALVLVPEELASESVLEGGPGEGGEGAEIERALAWSVDVFEVLNKQVRKDGPGKSDDEDGRVRVKEEAEEDGPEANVMDVDAKLEPVDGEADSTSRSKLEPDGEQEDPLFERLRLNLLALAKRAPLDKIAKLPVELVPERIRGIVPTTQ